MNWAQLFTPGTIAGIITIINAIATASGHGPLPTTELNTVLTGFLGLASGMLPGIGSNSPKA